MGTFLCFAKETYPKKRPCCLRPLRFAAGQPGVLVRGCAVELTARLRRSVQTTTASQLTKRVCPAAHPPPRALRASGASRRGGEQTTGSPFFWVRFFASPKKRTQRKATPVCDPFASAAGQPGVLVRGVRRGTHCAPAALRSNNHGESVDEAGVLRHTRHPRALRASGASRGWGANNRVAFLLGTFLCFAKETYPKERRPCDPFARCGAAWGARARGAPWNSLRACGIRSNNHGESVDP